jgi:hypothetical protein
MKGHLLLISICLLSSAGCLPGDEKPAAEKPAAASPPAETPGGGKEVKLTPLTAEEQQKLLASRRPGAMIGNLNSFASLLYAVSSISVGTDDKEIAETDLSSPFPEFYEPTVAEFFDSIARQCGVSWSYDMVRSRWMFNKPAKPMPFTIKLAKGWESEERGNYLFCKPPDAEIGMDIYVMARFSADPEDEELPAKMREATALMFAERIKEDITAKEMSTVKAGNLEALHLKIPAPRPGTTWRQWAIAEDGQVIVIVSAIDDGMEKKVLPGVEEMIKSFKLKPLAK